MCRFCRLAFRTRSDLEGSDITDPTVAATPCKEFLFARQKLLEPPSRLGIPLGGISLSAEEAHFSIFLLPNRDVLPAAASRAGWRHTVQRANTLRKIVSPPNQHCSPDPPTPISAIHPTSRVGLGPLDDDLRAATITGLPAGLGLSLGDHSKTRRDHPWVCPRASFIRSG